jgi:heme-degrading monooxygenase HmoA
MFIVIVLFEPPADAARDNEAAVRDVLDRIVSRQPGFVRARLHRGTGPTEGMVVNYMEWESAEAFHAFREKHGGEVSAAVGKFSPRFTFHTVAHEVGAWVAEPA